MSANELNEQSEKVKVVPLAVDEEIFQFLPRLNEIDLFGKGEDGQGLRRQSLFLFAMAIGYHKGRRTPLKNSHGLIRAEYFAQDDVINSIIQALHIHILRQEAQEDKIDNLNDAYAIANEYANTGFHYLKDMVTDPDFNEEMAQLTLRAECRKMSQA